MRHSKRGVLLYSYQVSAKIQGFLHHWSLELQQEHCQTHRNLTCG
jgi:hypothetical protein